MSDTLVLHVSLPSNHSSMPFSESNLLVLTPDWISRCTVLKGKGEKRLLRRGWRGNLEELARRVATVEASPGLRRRLRRRGGARGGARKGGEVVGEGGVGFHLRPEVLPLEVVRMVLRLHLVLAGVLHSASCFFHFHGEHALITWVTNQRDPPAPAASMAVSPSPPPRGPQRGSSSRREVRRRH